MIQRDLGGSDTDYNYPAMYNCDKYDNSSCNGL